MERLQRLTQGFAEALLRIFPERASALGSALGLEPERILVSILSLSSQETEISIGSLLGSLCAQEKEQKCDTPVCHSNVSAVAAFIAARSAGKLP